MLSPVLSGEKTYEQIVTHDDAWYAAHGVVCRFGEHVTKIDRARKVVVSKGGETPYDALVLATGSAPFIIPVAGKELSGVCTYRDRKPQAGLVRPSGRRPPRMPERPARCRCAPGAAASPSRRSAPMR